ncbi:tandem-type lipoprotein [Listeria grayi]|uniref:tandem-type lipoprotein n=1 Tax=Listeria grayi TaxID=1641 RepID=UPI0021AB243B|nr:tandem-type lipoprotein [Listeria grayi]
MVSILIGGMMIMSLLGGCGKSSKDEKTKQTEQSFDKVLAMYPTKNLEDFYDMEGYRDDEFEKGDKGTWVLQSSLSIAETKEAPLVSEGMLLRLNRNTRTARGFYFHREIKTPDVTEKKYPVTYDKNGFHLEKEISDSKLKEKIKNFQFFVQYGEFKQLNQYKNIDKMYNPEVPMYELEYQLTNDDYNVRQLRKQYPTASAKAPTLLLKGRGNLDGSSGTVGYKNIEFTFDKKVDNYYTESIDYQPTNVEGNQ